MKLERFTWKLALFWASFRMVADMLHTTINGLVNLIATTALIAAIAYGGYWLWSIIGPLVKL